MQICRIYLVYLMTRALGTGGADRPRPSRLIQVVSNLEKSRRKCRRNFKSLVFLSSSLCWLKLNFCLLVTVVLGKTGISFSVVAPPSTRKMYRRAINYMCTEVNQVMERLGRKLNKSVTGEERVGLIKNCCYSMCVYKARRMKHFVTFNMSCVRKRFN